MKELLNWYQPAKFLFWGVLVFHLSFSALAEDNKTKWDDRSPQNFQIDNLQPLGQIKDASVNSEAAGMKEYGLAVKVKQKLTFDGVKTSGNGVVFSEKTSELFWFAQFTISGSMSNNISRRYRIAWYEPSGKLFHEHRFKSSLINETFVKTSLKLPQPLPENLIGRWRVRVWKRDALIDDRYFEIVKSEK